MLEIEVISNAAAAEALLDPMRSTLLAALREPASAAALAAKLDLPRQKVNYHLRTLEAHGLLTVIAEHKRGNVTERVMSATAKSYVISPATLPAVAPDPALAPNRLSARWMLAVAARLVNDVGQLILGADRAKQRVATFALDGELTFANSADRAAFVAELSQATASLVRKYHSETDGKGRKHRLVVALHPSLTASSEKENNV